MTLDVEGQLLACAGASLLLLAGAARVTMVRGPRSWAGRVLSTLLFFCAAQYSLVCGLGVAGLLSPNALFLGSLAAAAGSLFCRHTSVAFAPRTPTVEHRMALAIGTFAAGYALTYAVHHRYLPVLETDALAYHLPTAIGWIQTGRLPLFDAWYWNPANTYSPLAAESMMAWTLCFLRSDALVRYVQLPALMLLGAAVYRLARRVGTRPSVAACVGVAAMLSRSIFAQATLVKDDLFVAAFFITAVEALSALHAIDEQDRLAAWRAGIATGLLLATKYPALLTIPVLLLAVPWRRLSRRDVVIVTGLIALLAGPWFLRNWIAFGNPFAPMLVKIGRWTLLPGLFNVSRSGATRTPAAIWAMVTNGYFATPAPLLLSLLAMFGVAVVYRIRHAEGSPLMRFAIIGPVLGPVVFTLLSPHPELRYFFPFLLPIYLSVAVALRVLDGWPRAQLSAAAALAVAGLCSSFRPELLPYAGWFALGGIAAAGAAYGASTLWPRHRWALGAAGGVTVVALGVFSFVNWRSYLSALDDAAAFVWPQQYGQLGTAWIAMRDHVPATAAVAYADTNLIYPLQGPGMHRRVIYAPTQNRVNSPLDLPTLGNHVPQDQIVATVAAAMNRNADERAWNATLDREKVDYLFIAKRQITTSPPELAFALGRPDRFVNVFENADAMVFELRRGRTVR